MCNAPGARRKSVLVLVKFVDVPLQIGRLVMAIVHVHLQPSGIMLQAIVNDRRIDGKPLQMVAHVCNPPAELLQSSTAAAKQVMGRNGGLTRSRGGRGSGGPRKTGLLCFSCF